MAKRKSFKQQKFSGIQMLVVALAFGVIGGIIGWAAFAAPHHGGGGNKGTNTISLVVSTDVNGDGLPNYGDTVTYKVSSTVTSAPSVKTSCVQNGVEVLHGDTTFYDGNPFAYTNYLKLTSGIWSSGAADCTATMYYNSHNKQVTLATLNFHVYA